MRRDSELNAQLYTHFGDHGAHGAPPDIPDTERPLRRAIAEYMTPDDIASMDRALAFLREIPTRQQTTAQQPDGWNIEHAITYGMAVAQALADALHFDTVTLVAVLFYQLVRSQITAPSELRQRLGGALGEQVAHTIASLERFDALQRPGADLRRSARNDAASEETSRTRQRVRQRQRLQDADNLRRMFMAMAEDPRVVVIKIADQLRLMRAVRAAADWWRAHADDEEPSGDAGLASAGATVPMWALAECEVIAQETRDIYAPLAARLGMGLMESELEDLAFAVLEPHEYQWLSEAVAEQAFERSAYVERVCAVLREEIRKIGIEAEVSGRVKHLYSIYKKVQRSGSHDLSALYDILAFRVIVRTNQDCYQVLGHVHQLWRPKDGRIKDFIASAKPNGYQSLHTTVFCLDGRLAEIQIRTREMHHTAEYGLAMHWYYKAVGDTASATAKPLQVWVQQFNEWQQEVLATTGVTGSPVPPTPGDALKDQIWVFTPAGDAKELPAGATPLDFAYRVHTDLGNHVAGVRITSDDGSGHLTKKLVPLDYELRSGDVVEIIKRTSAHPTRDWLRVARTKVAQSRIQRYLNGAERERHLLAGRERLEHELAGMGLRRGVEELDDGDLDWLAQEMGQSNPDGLFIAIGNEKVRLSAVLARIRERLRIQPPELQPVETPIPLAPARESHVGASVEGMAGMLTSLASCCNPLPGDDLLGYITRGRGVMVHRADCPNLRYLLSRQPERAVTVDWPKLDNTQTFRAAVVIEGDDRTGLLRDVTGVVSDHKINMLRVSVGTRRKPDRATISAVLEIQRPDQLEQVLRDIRRVSGVELAERKSPGARRGDVATHPSPKRPRKG